MSFVFLLAVFIASRDLFKPGYFSMHDDLQIGRLYEMDLCFRDGQIPCRWVPDMGYSYGYPLFNYYPPFPFYLGELIHKFGFSFIDTTKILFILGFLVSGILMYLFARKLWGVYGGLLSAVLYLFAPYHSVDVYVRGAMNEFWALSFLPGVFWAVYEIIEKKERKFIPVLALLFGLLLLSHNLMAFIFPPTIIVFSLLLIWLKKKNFKEKITNLFLGSILSFGLAAFFTLPVLLEKKFVHVETMLMGYFNYLAHYVSIGKMLFTRFWGYGSSGWLQETGMPFQVGFPQWPLAILVVILFDILYLKKKIKKEHLFIGIYFLLLFLFTLFLVHPRSVFIWDRIPLLAYLQFPWRFLTLVIFSISVLGGGLVFILKQKKLQAICFVLLSASVILLNYSFFRVEKTLQVTDTEKLFSAKGFNKLQTDAIFDYLPVYAKAPPGGPAPQKPEVKSGAVEISEIKKGTNWYTFRTKAEGSSKLQVPIYDFPGWTAFINSKKTEISHDNYLGLITINVPGGINEIKLYLKNTLVRSAGNLISLFSWVFLLILFWQLSLKRKWRKK